MKLEERVRAALHDDAGRIQVPARPAPTTLQRRGSVSGLRLGAVLAVAVLVFVALVAVDVTRPTGIEIQPADPAEQPADESVSFDAEGGDVFASGQTNGVNWRGAARMRGNLTCIGVRIAGPQLNDSVASCAPTQDAIPLRARSLRAGDGVVAVVGWVSDEVSRVTWEMPDRDVELRLHTRPGMDTRVFAGAQHGADVPTTIWAYDAEDERLGAAGIAGETARAPQEQLTEPLLGAPIDWRTLASSPLGPRSRHLAVWTGDEVIVWGGVDDAGGVDPFSSSGAAYDPTSRQWRRIAAAPIAARHDPLAAWTGDEMFVWGGSAAFASGDVQGALYDPVSDTWRATAAFPSIPASAGVAVWTDERVLVWGQPLGAGPSDTPPTTAAYDPATNQWTRLQQAPISGHSRPTGVWTGDELVVFGGGRSRPDLEGVRGTAAGAAYDPTTDTWRMLPEAPIDGRLGHTAVWTGTEMIIWGGSRRDATGDVLADGAAYDPEQDRWRTLEPGPLAGRYNHLATWTGSRMIVFGGQVRTSGSTWDHPRDAAAYSARDDTWTKLPDLSTGVDWWNVKAVPISDGALYWGEHDGAEVGATIRPSPTDSSESAR